MSEKNSSHLSGNERSSEVHCILRTTIPYYMELVCYSKFSENVCDSGYIGMCV